MITLLNEKLTVTNLQKLVFLAQEESNVHYFDFSPYRFGCYSFQLQADIEVLEKQQWLTVSNNKIKLKNTPKHRLVETYGDKIRYFLFNEKSRLRGDKLIGHNGDEQLAISDVKKKYWDEFVLSGKKDLHLILGTVNEHHNKKAPNPFIIIGVLPFPFEQQLGFNF